MLCAIADCERNVSAAGMCGSHYKRWWRYGDPLKGGTPHGAAKAWLDDAVLNETDECLPFPYAKHKGHGVVHIGGSLKQAHRYVLAQATGEDPADKEAAHSCRDGSCCNKRHLRWDTHAGNMADMIEHGTSTRGERNARHILTEPEVREIKRDLRAGVLCRVLAERHYVSSSAVHSIKQGRNWGWLA